MAVETSAVQVMSQVDLAQLLPQWRTVLSGFPTTGDQVSTWFVVLLLGMASFFVTFSLWKMHLSKRGVLWLERLIRDQRIETVSASRQRLFDRARSSRRKVAQLWLEFDETLLERDRAGKVILYSTHDAARFFNASTLASGLIESRMLAAVPGFLTAFGVMGTFVGLQLGLAQFDVDSNASMEAVGMGVVGAISGVRFAFMTSVWGVGLSLLFNLVEKSAERSVCRKVARLQQRIEKLFPHISAEGQLQRIANDSEQTRATLQVLGDKIGDKMQQSLLGVTEGIQASLEASLRNIMAPAMNMLVDETSDSNQKALENLLDKFMEKFGAEGLRQRQGLDEASDRINASLADFGIAMQTFLNRMETSQNDSAQRERDLVQKISVQVDNLVESSHTQSKKSTELFVSTLEKMSVDLSARDQQQLNSLEAFQNSAVQREREVMQKMTAQVDYLVDGTNAHSRKLTEFVGHSFDRLTTDLSTRDQRAAEREQFRAEEFIKQTEAMKMGTTELLERIDSSVQTQFATIEGLLVQGRELQDQVETTVKANVDASNSMSSAVTELNAAASSINSFGGRIQEAGEQLSGAVTAAVGTARELAEQNRASGEAMQQLRTQLVEDISEFRNVVDKLGSVIERADQTFDNMADHQRDYLAGLRENVEALATQMTELLQSYAERANSQTESHLNMWSEKATGYATQMNGAVQALSRVVDEIEDKLGR